jgi:hypothetical protein
VKRFLLLIGLFSLTACAAKPNAQYSLSFDAYGQTRRQELLDAAARVLERKAAHLNIPVSNVQSAVQGTTGSLRFTTDPASLPKLRQALTALFSFELMVEAPKDKADIWNEKHGGFKQTGITEKDLTWVSSVPQGKSAVTTIDLTDAGKQKLAAVFKDNQGKLIALFVNQTFVSGKYANSGDVTNASLTIDVPNQDIAKAFADDMNVGTHVTFRPETAASVSSGSTVSVSSQP